MPYRAKGPLAWQAVWPPAQRSPRAGQRKTPGGQQKIKDDRTTGAEQARARKQGPGNNAAQRELITPRVRAGRAWSP